MLFQGGQIWQILSFDLHLVGGHVINDRFTIHIRIVSEENGAGLHMILLQMLCI